MCVLGLGLIGGSILRAATAAGREAFGYNRSVEGAQAARFDGFDATTDLTKALTRAADLDALIVLAVPMPALPTLLTHVSRAAPDCPLTDEQIDAYDKAATPINKAEQYSDGKIWPHKAYVHRPMLSAVDGPILKYREWYRQFDPRPMVG